MTVTLQNGSDLEVEALNEVHRIASSLSQFLQDKYPRTVLPTPNISELNFCPLDLEYPYDILSPISTLPIPESLRQEILLYCHRRIDEMQQKYLTTYRRTCLSNLQNPYLGENMTAIRDTYRVHYKRHSLIIFQSLVSLIVAKVTDYQIPPSVEVKKPFNNEYIPMLEKYFEFNGYPSVAHRTILASNSGMAPRQIEVWFQNHRNRAKKENRIVHRLDSDLPLKKALAVQRDCVPKNRLPTPPTERPDSDFVDEETRVQPVNPLLSSSSPLQNQSSKSPSLLDDSYQNRPPHAYPSTSKTPYSEPFPNEDGKFTFPTPTWRRKPTSTPKISVAVDMDEFANEFHLKLNFSEPSRRRMFTPLSHGSPFHPWYSATTTFVTSAPHPALIRTPSAHRPTSANWHSIDAGVPKPIFGSSSMPTCTSPHPKLSVERSPRKIRPLPRRIPPQSRSQSFGSRTSSFSSDTSSSNYLSSPELSTPPPLPSMELPLINAPVFHEGGSEDMFDFSSAGLNTNLPSATLMPVQNFGLATTHPTSNKFSNVSFLDNIFPDFGHHLGEIIS